MTEIDAPLSVTPGESVADRHERIAKLIGCPHCAAGCLEPCRSKQNKPVEKTHVARFRAWRKRRKALAAALATAESHGWTQRPEPNVDYRMRNHTPEKIYDEGRVRLIKIEVLKDQMTGGFRFWFHALDGRSDGGAADALTANLFAVGGPWARTFEKLS